MKKIFFIVLALLVVIFGISMVLSACDFDYKVYNTIDDLKEDLESNNLEYNLGDVVYLKIMLRETHNRCLSDIEDVEYEFENLTVLGATDWETVYTGSYERIFKIQFDQSVGNAFFTAFRVCDKDGGTITVNFDINNG